MPIRFGFGAGCATFITADMRATVAKVPATPKDLAA
jgi:hypothetical protein